ncbi:MAG: hypothetical protein WBE50_10895, partial [Methyloceanibacter sp.]
MLGGAFGLQHRSGYFFDEERNAVRAFDDVATHVRRQRLAAEDAVDHHTDFALRQPVERQRRHMRATDPGRVEFRPECDNQQNGERRDPV